MLVYWIFFFHVAEFRILSCNRQWNVHHMASQVSSNICSYVLKCNEMLSAVFYIFICWIADLQLPHQEAPKSPGAPHRTA